MTGDSSWTSHQMDMTISQDNFTPTSVTDNQTTTTLTPVHWSAIALGLIVIATAFGNILLCVAVFTERRLQNMTNYFLTSLAVADLLVAVVVMPLAVVVQIYDGHFPLGATMCIIWATMDVLMCTASIWHMATISVDRYCSLRFPLRYGPTRTPLFVAVKIAFVWIVSISICSSLAVVGFINPRNVYRDTHCVPVVPEFVIYGSIFAFFVPLVIMIVTYALTVRTLSRKSRIWRREVPRSQPLRHVEHSESRQTGRLSRYTILSTASSVQSRSLRHNVSHQGSTAPSSSPALVYTTQEMSRTDTGNDHKQKMLSAALSMPELQLTSAVNDADGDCVIRPAVSHAELRARSDSLQRNHDTREHVDSCSHGNKPTTAPDSTLQVMTSQHDHLADVTSCHNNYGDDDDVYIHRHVAANHRTAEYSSTKSNPAGGVTCREEGRANASAAAARSRSGRVKRKATLVLGVMFVVFVVLWTPFFVLNILSAACPACVQTVAPSVWTVLVWFGWVSSLANPIIYTCFSPAFRATFRQLLTCRHQRHRGARSQAKSRQQQWTNLLRRRREKNDSV